MSDVPREFTDFRTTGQLVATGFDAKGTLIPPQVADELTTQEQNIGTKEAKPDPHTARAPRKERAQQVATRNQWEPTG